MRGKQLFMKEELFVKAYDKYKNTVYSVIFNYVRNNDDTAELHQEVFIKLLRYEGDFESDEHMKAWLLRVSINMCKNHLRDMKHMSAEPIDEEIPYEENESHGELLRYVLALPEKYRVPIHLFYYEDYSVKQIAQVLGIPEATVKIRLKRGKEKLKKVLNREDWL